MNTEITAADWIAKCEEVARLTAALAESERSLVGARAMADDFKRRAEERAPVRQEHGTGPSDDELVAAQIVQQAFADMPPMDLESNKDVKTVLCRVEAEIVAALRASRERRGGQS